MFTTIICRSSSISLRTTEHNSTNLTLRVFTMRYYTSVVSLVQIDRRLWTFWLIDFQEPLKAFIVNTLKVKLVELCSVVLKDITKM
jgi:hypothetical protein